MKSCAGRYLILSKITAAVTLCEIENKDRMKAFGNYLKAQV